jgi:glycosyltransferase involved in cell wall biosynthesis
LKISIVIPAFNEQDTIRQSIQGVLVTDFGTYDREIVVVDDASTDNTRMILREFGDDIIFISHLTNKGKGAAIRTALEVSSGEIVAIHDADLEYDPKDLPKLIAPIAAGRVDAVFGSRFLLKRHPEGMKAMNLLANKILAVAANMLFKGKLTDEATCYKAVRTDILRSLDLQCMRFEFCPEVTAKLLRGGHKIAEVPVWYKARTVEEGKKIHWYDGLEAIWTLLKYRILR